MKQKKATPRGGHEDQQKGSDSKTALENKPDYRAFRDKALLHLHQSMHLCIQEMFNDNLHNSVRVKWANCLAQTVGALCNLIRTLKVLEADVGELDDLDWGQLMAMGDAAPTKYKDPVYKEKLRRTLNIDLNLSKKQPRDRHVTLYPRQRIINLKPKKPRRKRQWWRSER